MSASNPTYHLSDADQEVANLVLSAQRDDIEAFNRLVLLFQERVYNLAFRLLGDRESAEDAAQNAFISAYRNLASFRGGSFRAWLLRTVKNSCIDEIRRRERHQMVALEPVTNDEGINESPQWLADDSPLPEAEVERIEREQVIQLCLDDLPIEFRSVVVLVDVQGMDYREVAKIIGKPLGTIKSRLARARHKLSQSLQMIKSGLFCEEPMNQSIYFEQVGSFLR